MTLSVLLARQRSGTGALGSILDQHPAISYLGEVFHDDSMDKPPNYFCYLRSQAAGEWDIVLPNAAPARFDSYARFLEEHTQTRHTVIDVKYRSTHHFNAHWMGIGETPGLFDILRARRIPIVHLLRRNYLKLFVSGRLAEMNRVWHAKAQSDISVHKLKVDIRACIGFINAQMFEDERIQLALKAYPKLLALDYTELFEESGNLSRKACENLATFFDVPAFERTRPVFIKQTSRPLREVVTNFDDLADALRNTAHGWMLNVE